jgi:hypothetical protein
MAKTHECWECGGLFFKKDIVDERTMYPGRKTQYLCRSCKEKKVALMIERQRAELGLPKRKETP